ncbi:hypothetical protein [Rhodoplanes sp. Z2-YC6860]|uniref:hypothetical protein n=1 Tax=Rhodoplanes sp. Z2-YC6860 TaxID=674703 RepID=UPI00078E770A|nr:hypothetical protein [Rhodoplanes sp. Z2-YC6860]AMN38891.1 hypothetical protein RHPLAN_04260 [Rhodoplanes sp. Z2-YC6860]
MALGRLLLRFLIVPFGFCLATMAAVLFVIAAHWSRFMAIVAANRGGDEDVALFVAGSFIVLIAAISAAKMLWPFILAAALAEAFAFRSWVFHVCSGAVAALIGLNTLSDSGAYDLYNAPVIVVGAGFAAGFVYWLIAGWSAGFWKPVFAPPRQPLPQAQSLPGAPPPAP